MLCMRTCEPVHVCISGCTCVFLGARVEAGILTYVSVYTCEHVCGAACTEG